MRIILSRTDSIGDVVLTLPMAGVLKQNFPDAVLIFLGRDYTRPVVELSRFIDRFVSWDEIAAARDKRSKIDFLARLEADVVIHVFPVKEICRVAKQAGIPLRIATARRYFTWTTCNRLMHIPRRNSKLHEAQLNLKMLRPLGIDRPFHLDEIPPFYGISPSRVPRPETVQPAGLVHHQDNTIVTVILHPKSKGSAREWGLPNYSKLIGLLPEKKFRIFITGTAEEGAQMEDFLRNHASRVIDMTGKLNLSELISLIGVSDALVAASTGPLHIAAALGIHAIGIYAPMRPIFPQRWAPVGVNADHLVLEKKCNDCRKTMDCHCIRSITPESVALKLTTLGI